MKKLVIVLIVIILGLGGFIGWKFFLSGDKDKEKKEETIKVSDMSAEELLNLTVKPEGEGGEAMVSTELADGAKIRLQYDVVLENEKAKTEFTNRSSQMSSTTLETLMSKASDEVYGAAGKQNLQLALKKKFNKYMKEGKVIEVYITKISIS
ncbi:flagellar basal body-associated FliL family protein [Priestia filamentosa]|uniref:flagellar basal body-associated FliL family protein n=1 Tax=Priestia filamentosa TaxID=1402861 RepID=UPI00397D5527